MYSIDHCHLCNSSLVFDTNERCYDCSNNPDHYTVWDDGVISIKVDEYLFEYYPKDYYNSEKMRVWKDKYNPCYYELNYHVYVDLNNYLEVLERLKILQVFK